MLPHILPISSLMVGTALLLLGNGLLTTLIALRGSVEGFGDQLLGLMGSSYFVGFLVGTWVVPRLIRRMGHIRAFNFFAASIAVIVLIHSIVVNPWVWLGLRMFTGIALVGFYTVIESWLNSRSVPERRGQVFAFYMVVNMSALALAQQFLHFAGPETFVLFSVAAIMVCLSVLPLASTRQPQPEIHSMPRVRLRELWKAAPAAVVGSVVSGLSMGTFWSIAPLYANRLGFDAGGVATLMTATIVGGALLQIPLGRFSDWADRRYALALAAGGATLAAVLMAVLGAVDMALFATAFVFGGMAFAIYPITVAHLVDHLSHEHILSGNSGMLLLHGLGAVAGPAVAGALMGVVGPVAMPLFFAAVLGPLTLYVLWCVRRGRDEIVEEAALFQPMMRTAPTAMEIAAAVEEHHIETAQEEAASDDAAAAGEQAPPEVHDDTVGETGSTEERTTHDMAAEPEHATDAPDSSSDDAQPDPEPSPQDDAVRDEDKRP